MNSGNLIKSARIKKGMTQSELSQIVGLTLRTIQRIENDKVKPSLHSLRQLSTVLEFDQSQFDEKNDLPKNDIHLHIRIADMNEFLSNITSFLQKHWKLVILLLFVVWFSANYVDIKKGFVDGWNGF